VASGRTVVEDVVVKKFTFAISSPDEFFCIYCYTTVQNEDKQGSVRSKTSTPQYKLHIRHDMLTDGPLEATADGAQTERPGHLKPRLHDTTGCQTGLTTRCIA